MEPMIEKFQRKYFQEYCLMDASVDIPMTDIKHEFTTCSDTHDCVVLLQISLNVKA